MPKMVLCCKDNVGDKFFDVTQIPKGWIVDRLYHQQLNPGGVIKEMTVQELEAKGIIVKSSAEVKLADPEPAPATTEGLDITGQVENFKEGDVVGEEPDTKVKKKPGPKPKVKTEDPTCPPEL